MEAGQEVVTKDQVPSVPLIHPPAILFLDTIKLGGHHFGPLRNNLFMLTGSSKRNHWQKLISPRADSPVEHRQPWWCVAWQ